MLRFIVLIKAIFLLTSSWAESKMIIAVIDTGLEINKITKKIPLCSGLHADFTKNKIFMAEPPQDKMKHGTNVAATINDTIEKNTKSKNYCLAIIKYTDIDSFADNDIKAAFANRYARHIGAKVINFSSSGPSESELETKEIKKTLDAGIKVFVSAGNNGKYINKPEKVCLKTFEKFKLHTKCKRFGAFPAMSDDRIVVVGNLRANGERYPNSNYGPRVSQWEVGENIVAGGYKKTGTSQATAIATGKYVGRILNEKQ